MSLRQYLRVVAGEDTVQVDREARSVRISPGFRSRIFDGSLISTPHFLASSRNWATLDEYHPSFPTKSSISCIKFTNPASSPVDATHSKAQSGRTGVTPHPDSGTDSRESTHKRIVRGSRSGRFYEFGVGQPGSHHVYKFRNSHDHPGSLSLVRDSMATREDN